jgi:hypothetical protein
MTQPKPLEFRRNRLYQMKTSVYTQLAPNRFTDFWKD